MGKEVKVVLKDNRVVYGRLSCMDKGRNLFLVDCIMKTDQEYIAPINDSLKFYVHRENQALRFLNDISLDGFNNDKHLIGNVVVPGSEIERFMVKTDD